MRVALATTPLARDLDEDYAPLAAAFAELGHAAEAPCWDDPAVDWRRYGLVLLRSTWNYTEDLAAFLGWVTAVSEVTRLFNPLATLRWSTNKRYLLDLKRAGVPIVPTTVTAPGEAWAAPDAQAFVIKPGVGAGSRGAKRFARAEHGAAREHAARLNAAGFDVLTQPYLTAVDDSGETGLICYEGEFSHAIRKGALLGAGGGEIEGLFAKETIDARVAASDELEIAHRALAATPGGAPLYARVDLIRDDRGTPCVLELEMAEPSMYFNYAPGSASRFARAALARLAASR